MFVYISDNSIKWYTHFKGSLGVSHKVKYIIFICSSSFISKNLLNIHENICQSKYCKVQSSVTYNSPKLEKQTSDWVNKLRYMPTVEYYIAILTDKMFKMLCCAKVARPKRADISHDSIYMQFKKRHM